jgi:regulator of protease activity HflC (stomatin/prohibitin superfamily)
MERRSPDAEVAQAINRVLAAEREAAGSIKAAQLEAEKLIEAARAERRRLLERARLRAARLHAAAQSRLERSLARLDLGATAPGTDFASLHELTQQAVGRLARRLTAADHEPR